MPRTDLAVGADVRLLILGIGLRVSININLCQSMSLSIPWLQGRQPQFLVKSSNQNLSPNRRLLADIRNLQAAWVLHPSKVHHAVHRLFAQLRFARGHS
jgi:hypothetical protein